MPSFDHFDFLAPHYERFIKPRPPQALMDAAALPAGAPVLDIGGGTGRVSQFLALAGHPVTLVDLAPQMLAQAAAKPGLRPLLAPAECLPFANGAFPAVIIVDALHHVHSQEATLAELWRVLAPGGTLVVEEPDLRRPLVKLLALAEKLALMRSHFLSPPQIAAMLPAIAKARIEADGFNAWVIATKPYA